MVSYFHSSNRDDLHINEGAAVLEYTCVHNLQKLDDHLNRLWRGSMVWRQCDGDDAIELRSDGSEQCHCCLGRYSTRTGVVLRRQHKWRSSGEDRDFECGLHLDVAELLLLGSISTGDEEKDQAYQLQRPGQ